MERSEDYSLIAPAIGKVVKDAHYDISEIGQFVHIEFTDGTFLRVEEAGQAGWLSWVCTTTAAGE